MKDERLYIDDELVDLGTDTKITLNLKSNLFRDVSKIISNSTYTIKLPMTARNKRLFLHADLVQESAGYAYKTHQARYFRDGVEVIKDGVATILQVSDNAIEIAILWGLFAKFSKLLSDGKALDKLDTTDRILYPSQKPVEKYDDAKKKNYFYVFYDVWRKDVEPDYTWKSTQELTLPTGGYGNSSNFPSHTFGGSRAIGNSTNVDNLHPVVRASWLLDLIKEKTGVDFQFAEAAKEYIDTLIIPLVSNKSNELTFDKNFEATLPECNTFGVVPVTISKASNVFTARESDTVTELVAAIDTSVILDVSGEWEGDLRGAKPQGHGNRGYGNTDDFFFNNVNRIFVKVRGSGEDQIYPVGNSQDYILVSVPSGYRDKVKFSIKGSGKIDLKKGNSIVFEWGSSNTTTKFLGGRIKATLQVSDSVPTDGYFPITSNLPKIKIIDYVKFLSAITGTFPLQVTSDGSVKFMPLSEIWAHKADAVDWTRRVTGGQLQRPKGIEFVVSGYAQRNLYKWKADDRVSNVYDGVVAIDNETLEKERVVFEFPFAATNGDNVPMYTGERPNGFHSGGSFGGGDGTKVASEKAPTYSACKDRILRLMQDANGFATGWFDINMQEIINTKYREVVNTLRYAKVVSVRINIRNMELLNFDETRPIYLAQYASYFAVLEIKAESDGTAEVTLLKLEFN